METDGEQNQPGASTNGSPASGTSSRPSPMNSMSLYERQAVQALQALQRQPNAAQYFQQLMLQQQINNAQLQNLAAVQQATLAASRQSSPSSSSSSQTTSTTAASVTSGSGSTTNSRPVASATSTISQSVLLSGAGAGQGQMYFRLNRSLRAPISPQLIFMPSNTATAAVATVTQQPQTQQQQQEVTPTSSAGGQSDNDQAQNLAMRGVSGPKGVKTEAPDRSDSAAYSLVHPSHQLHSQSPNKPNQPQSAHIKIPTYPQPTNLKAHPSSSSTSSSIPLSQLLLHGTRTITTGTSVPHTLVLTSASQPHGYAVSTATIKPAGNAQTLVVQPLQKSSLGNEKLGHAHSNGPVPIQPKTLQGLRLPLQLPSRNPPPILPAPPPSNSSSQPPQTPHIPVQIVGARQSALGNTQALTLARGNTHCGQDVLNSSPSLLTMVASIASREGGMVGRGAGLKMQEGLPLAQVSQVHPRTNQSSGQSQNGTMGMSQSQSTATNVTSPTNAMSRSNVSVAMGTEEQRKASTNGEAAGSQTTQGKQLTGSLKRKSDSKSANDEDGPSPPRLQPIRDLAPALSSNPVEAGCGAPPPASPSPSPMMCVSRGVCGPGERAPPPQAVVKPNVLTHLIEGFVIQEGAEPFPVCGSVKDSSGEDLTNDSPETNQSETVTTATVLKCEYCKNFAPAAQFRGTKRFCSMTCAKRYNASFRQHFLLRDSPDNSPHENQTMDHMSNSEEEGGKAHSEEEGGGVTARRRVPRRTSSEIASAKIAGRPLPVKFRSESSHSEEDSSVDEDEDDPMSLSPASSASCQQSPPPPTTVTTETGNPAPSCLPDNANQWSVEEVTQFISSLQGCEDIASQFLSQEIDGQALLLLKEEHLMSTMNIKLGPALKICAHINTLRD